MQINIADFDYTLPEEKIAFYPLENRNASKLLVYKKGEIVDSSFEKITDFLTSDHLLIFNDSRVIHARLLVKTKNGASVEIFCLEPLWPVDELQLAFQQKGKVIWKCMVGNAKRWKEPIEIVMEIKRGELKTENEVIRVTKGENRDGVFEVTFEWDGDVTWAEWLESYGKMPLPPYIKRSAEKADEDRYQTVYAHHDGSVAAPTAGLHFSEKELDALKEKGVLSSNVTLHVGAGTFKPVTAETAAEHYMHREQIVITAELIRFLLEHPEKKIIAVGTTVIRSLESIFIMGAKLKLNLENPFSVQQWEPLHFPECKQVSAKESLEMLLQYLETQNLDSLTGETALMILPGYQHKLVEGLLTNFHQPKSTLLLLIASFLGDEWKRIYAHALQHDYRFLSYGDANLYFCG